MKGWYKMRLIDADKMAVEESEAYISAQCQIKDELMRSVNAVVHTKIQRLIADTPTVDAVEVVWCKDCKHWLKDVPGCTDFVGRCEWANYMIGAVGYCVYGESRIGNAAD